MNFTFPKLAETQNPVQTKLFSDWITFRESLGRVFNACSFVVYDNLRDIS